MTMNRAEKRRKQRSAKVYDSRNTFTKSEGETMMNTAYEYGLFFVLQAAARVDGIGEKRLAELKAAILEIEKENNVYRASEPTWMQSSKESLKKGDRL